MPSFSVSSSSRAAAARAVATAAAAAAAKRSGCQHRRRAALLRANLGVLDQKLDLVEALRNALGSDRARRKFAKPCDVLGASVGQHLRHSTDHMERVADSLRDGSNNTTTTKKLHYDRRVRGGTDEHDMDEAEARIRAVAGVFRRAIDETDSADAEERGGGVVVLLNNPAVEAGFALSGDPSLAAGEFLLESTLDRELGFVAHHAIHHLAMVKVIAVHTLRLLPPEAIPEGFGRAPGTIVHDRQQDRHRQKNTVDDDRETRED